MNTTKAPVFVGDLKVLSYWNLNLSFLIFITFKSSLKVLSYWNLNDIYVFCLTFDPVT